ncbi:hypothetical protein ABW19_dt0202954 [Dactylella cylindrospora]|nr:hypothetical protein ABW19_dt0202954 [Dactylella cylindrospora]
MVELNPEDYTVAWIAPLEIEAQAALHMLDKRHEGHFALSRGNDYVYQAGEIFGHNVIIATFPAGQEYGTGSAAALASQVKCVFPNLWFGLLVGVAAGLPNLSREPPVDIRLGDILVGVPERENAGVVPYELGKQTAAGLQLLRSGHILATTERVVMSAITDIKLQSLDEAQAFLPHYEAIQHKSHANGTFSDPGQEQDNFYDTGAEKPTIREERPISNRTRVWYGPIGSGDKLMKSSTKRDELRDKYNIIGLEMEAAGTMNHIPVGVIRGVCDYGDEHKNKEWQPYAAAMAAAYAKTVLCHILPKENRMDKKSKFRIPVNLPHQRNPNFTGRMDQLNEISEAFGSADSSGKLSSRTARRVVGLSGFGGVGKSTIAVEYAHKHTNEYSAIFWINAASLSDLIVSARREVKAVVSHYAGPGEPSSEECQRIAHTLGLGHREPATISKDGLMDAVDKASPVDCLRNLLCQESNDEWLLIVDNYDNPNDFKLNTLLPTRDVGHILITSRSSNPYPGSRKIEVVGGVEEREAVDLLCKTSGRNITLNDNGVSHIVQSVGRLPYAIELIGAYLQKYRIPIEKYAGILSEDLEEPLERLNAIWEISFNKLSNNSKHMLQLLSLIGNEEIPDELLVGGKGVVDWMTSEKVIYEAVGELCSLSLISEHRRNHYCVHALLHRWTRDHQGDANFNNSFLIGSIITSTFRFDNDRTASQSAYEHRILPHIDYAFENFSAQWILGGGRLDNKTQEITYNFARVYANIGKVPRATEIYEISLKGVDDHVSIAELKIMDSFGVNLRLQGRNEEALTWCSRALRGTKSQVGEDDSESLVIASHVAAILTAQGKYPEAISEYRRVLGQEKRLGKSDGTVLETRQQLARVLRESGEYTEALSLLEQVRDERYKQLGRDHPLSLEAVHAISRILEIQGEYERALSGHKLVYEGQKEALGEGHYSTLETLSGIASTYERLGKYPDALECYEEVLRRLKAIFGEQEDHPWILFMFSGIADVLMRQQRYKEAEEMYKNAYAGFQNLKMGIDGEFPTATNIARALCNQGRYEEALDFCMKAQEGLKELGKHHILMLTAKACAANILEEQKEYEQALLFYEEVLEGYQKTQGPKHAETLKIILWIGNIHLEQEKYEKALELIEEAEAGLKHAIGETHPHTIKAGQLKEKAARSLQEAAQKQETNTLDKLDEEENRDKRNPIIRMLTCCFR